LVRWLMSLYAIWVTHIAGWAAETPVEAEVADAQQGAAEVAGASALVEAEPN
jgi:hypothetical protein